MDVVWLRSPWSIFCASDNPPQVRSHQKGGPDHRRGETKRQVAGHEYTKKQKQIPTFVTYLGLSRASLGILGFPVHRYTFFHLQRMQIPVQSILDPGVLVQTPKRNFPPGSRMTDPMCMAFMLDQGTNSRLEPVWEVHPLLHTPGKPRWG